MAGEIKRRLTEILDDARARELAKVGYEVWKDSTPVLSGNAKKRTRLVNDEIRAEYAYATRLDQGWSKKSPDGMSQPAIEAVQEYIQNGFKK